MGGAGTYWKSFSCITWGFRGPVPLSVSDMRTCSLKQRSAAVYRLTPSNARKRSMSQLHPSANQWFSFRGCQVKRRNLQTLPKFKIQDRIYHSLDINCTGLPDPQHGGREVTPFINRHNTSSLVMFRVHYFTVLMTMCRWRWRWSVCWRCCSNCFNNRSDCCCHRWYIYNHRSDSWDLEEL